MLSLTASDMNRYPQHKVADVQEERKAAVVASMPKSHFARGGAGAATSGRLTPEERITALTAGLHDALEEAVSGPGKWQELLDASATLWRYSGGNVALLMSQMAQRGDPPPSLVAGFKEWERHGCNVLKGEHALWVIAPRTARTTSVTMADGTRQRIPAGQQPPHGSVEEGQSTTVVGWRGQSVFDVSQTEGQPLLVPRSGLNTNAVPTELWDSLVRAAAMKGFKTAISQRQLSLASGFTDFETGQIQVGAWLGSEDRVAVLTHELGHVYLHGPKDDVGKLYGSGSEHRGLAEVEAESVAYTVLRAHGIDRRQQSASYLAGWSDAVIAAEVNSIDHATGGAKQLTRVDIAKSVLGRVTGATRNILDVTQPPGFGGKITGLANGRKADPEIDPVNADVVGGHPANPVGDQASSESTWRTPNPASSPSLGAVAGP